MSLLSSISSWVKKIVQPVVSTVSSWFAPTTAAPKAATATPYDLAAKLTKAAGYVPPTYVAAQPTTADYLKRKAEAEAALKKQYSWLGTGEKVTAGAAPIGQIPVQQPVSQIPVQQPTAWETLKSWFAPQQPSPVETWQPAKDVFGQSQQGQSLLDSLQNWMGKAGQAFQQPSFGVAQAQGLKETATPKVSTVGGEKGFTPEEWATMGRPLGGAYAGWGGVPPSGLEMAQTAVTPGVKYWWEGGTMMGAPTPEQLNTPEYVKGYFNTLFNSETHPELYDGKNLNATGEAASENFWDAFTSDAKDGYYTVEQISKDPKVHEDLVAEMLMRDKYDQKWVETLKDASLGKVITQVASQDPTKLPPTISQERLDAMERGPDFATLYDTGYRSQAYQNEAISVIQQLQSTGVPIIYYPDAFNSLTYANTEALKSSLNQITPAQWKTIIENGGQVALKTEFWKFNAKGETINKGSWDIDYPPQSAMTRSEKERYIDQQQFYNEWYWSDEAAAQRQKEREESYEYYQEKDLEGWKEYYGILDTMKLYPDASEYWSQAGKFAELRRKWETSDSGLSWDAWLQQFDFEGEWYALPPQERGEKKYIYSPRMIRLNY